MASGMPGASRRAVLGGATYSVVKVRVRLRGAVRPGSVTISATSLARVQRGGVNPGHCARGFGAMSLWPVSDWPVGGKVEARAPGIKIAQTCGRGKEEWEAFSTRAGSGNRRISTAFWDSSSYLRIRAWELDSGLRRNDGVDSLRL